MTRSKWRYEWMKHRPLRVAALAMASIPALVFASFFHGVPPAVADLVREWRDALQRD